MKKALGSVTEIRGFGGETVRTVVVPDDRTDDERRRLAWLNRPCEFCRLPRRRCGCGRYR